MGTYAGATRRRVHLAAVRLPPPSGHRPGRRQARHARIKILFCDNGVHNQHENTRWRNVSNVYLLLRYEVFAQTLQRSDFCSVSGWQFT